MTEKKKTGRPPGHPKTGGRKPGVPNKTSGRVREVIASLAEDNAEQFIQWVKDTAAGVRDTTSGDWAVKPDPKGAADIFLKALEYHIPKLSRVEHTGDGGDPIDIVTRIELVAPSGNGAD